MRRLLRRRALWAALASAALAVVICGGSVRNFFGKRRELSRLRENLAQSRRLLAEEEMQVARAEKDHAYLETSARRELGLLRADEIEFQFTARAETKPSE